MQTVNNPHMKMLLKLVRRKGILIKRMAKGADFLFDNQVDKGKQLGAVPVLNQDGKITNVYVVYEDEDGTIRYSDYPY